MGKIKSDKKTRKLLHKIKEETTSKIFKKEKVKEKRITLILKDELRTTAKRQINVPLDLDIVKVAIEGLFKLTTEKTSKKLFDEEYPVFLQVACVKIPNCPNRIVRLPLKHSLLTDTSEICLIVSDLKKGRNIDYNPTIEHYEELLRKHNITNIKRIIPLNCIKTEYDQFELKRRLVGQYDLFLADGKICGHLCHLLGKTFSIKRKMPTPVHLDRPDMKTCIEMAIRKTQMHIHSKGDSYLIQVGHSHMMVEDIMDNITTVCEELNKVMPGTWNNIRSLHVKSHLSVSIPIYMSLKSSNAVKTPHVKAKIPKLKLKVKGELSTFTDATVTVNPTGEVDLQSN